MARPIAAAAPTEGDRRLFWGCFVALVATSFGFIVRAMVIGEWATAFGLTETQKGEIFGVGLWPFAVSIVLFSLVIDRIGYGRAMGFAFACHVASAFLTIYATGYQSLYVATFIGALANGTVEAVINPVVATVFSREKTKWLNILHAGWPGGLVLGGLMALALGPETRWTYKVALVLIPAALYGLLLLGRSFPVHERVAAGVSYRDMLKEAGWLGALVVVALIVFEVAGRFGATLTQKLALTGLLTAVYGVYVVSPGRAMFVVLLLIMIPLATTELGTDSWITDLVAPEMSKLGLQAGWVLVYTSFIMMVLRFCAGPIVHRLSPLGLLCACSAIAAIGLVALSRSSGLAILVAATLYGVGKTFFWPTMLGVVAERFPRGGALTLNATGGVGMLGVGVVGAVLLGNIQDKHIESDLLEWDREHRSALHATYVGEPKPSIFGEYRALDAAKVASAPAADKATIDQVTSQAKKGALETVALFPVVMLVCYLALLAWFRARGGYQAVQLGGEEPGSGRATG